MNPDTGHLVDLTSDEFRIKLDRLEDEGYERVPERLQHAARTKLRGRSEAHVQLSSGGKLAQWAKKKRNRRRNKIAKQSRRANR